MGSATSKGARQVEAMITSVFAVRQSGLGRSADNGSAAFCSDLAKCGHVPRLAEPSSLTPKATSLRSDEMGGRGHQVLDHSG